MQPWGSFLVFSNVWSSSDCFSDANYRFDISDSVTQCDSVRSFSANIENPDHINYVRSYSISILKYYSVHSFNVAKSTVFLFIAHSLCLFLSYLISLLNIGSTNYGLGSPAESRFQYLMTDAHSLWATRLLRFALLNCVKKNHGGGKILLYWIIAFWYVSDVL